LRYYTYTDLPEGTEHDHERRESRQVSGTRQKPGTSRIRNRTAIFGGTIGLLLYLVEGQQGTAPEKKRKPASEINSDILLPGL